MNQEKKWNKQIKKNSNHQAANELITKYYKEMYSFVYKQTLNKELSLDLTQEIFISMLLSIQSFDEKKASFRTWLYKLATYRIVDYYRSKYYKYTQVVTPIENIDLFNQADFTLSFEFKEELEEVMGIVNKLDQTAQQLFRLKIFAEATFSEISDILHIPENSVKTKYYATIKKVKQGLRRDNGEKGKISN